MAVITPLTLKSTKGMLEMQRLAPELRKLQQQYRNDRTKLNEETMKLYQEHKVNPMSSCLPLVAQMPIFIIMFRILHGLTFRPSGTSETISQAIVTAAGQVPPGPGLPPPLHLAGHRAVPVAGGQARDDVARSGPVHDAGRGAGRGVHVRPAYVLLVVALGGIYFLQQRMVAARAMVSPTMSPVQQKLMQYLPVAFAVFQVFFLTGLVIYYAAQAVLRIAQQAYITRRFYGHDESLGRQAQRAGEQARELAKEDGGGGGLLSQARLGRGARTDDAPSATPAPKATAATPSNTASKRTTPPKNRPTPSGSNPSGRPTANRPGGGRAKKKR